MSYENQAANYNHGVKGYAEKNAPTALRDIGEVGMLIEQARNLADDCMQQFALLNQSLATVTRSQPPSEKTQCAPGRHTKYGAELSEIVYKLSGLNAALSGLRDRLEV